MADKPYPKLRGRQQITLRYRETVGALHYYEWQLEHIDGPASSLVARALRIHIAECKAALDAYTYCLNGVV